MNAELVRMMEERKQMDAGIQEGRNYRAANEAMATYIAYRRSGAMRYD
jgi:hypothetical protein